MRIISAKRAQFCFRIINRKFADALPSSSTPSSAVSTQVAKESVKATVPPRDGSTFFGMILFYSSNAACLSSHFVFCWIRREIWIIYGWLGGWVRCLILFHL